MRSELAGAFLPKNRTKSARDIALSGLPRVKGKRVKAQGNPVSALIYCDNVATASPRLLTDRDNALTERVNALTGSVNALTDHDNALTCIDSTLSAVGPGGL